MRSWTCPSRSPAAPAKQGRAATRLGARFSSLSAGRRRHRLLPLPLPLRALDDDNDDDSLPPDWDAEMSLFRARLSRPAQAATLRQLEAKVERGSVLASSAASGIAVVSGLDNDAPVGTELAFSNGVRGALLWRRSDNLCIALLLDGGEKEKEAGAGEGKEGNGSRIPSVSAGDECECKVKAILQVVDASTGPATKREYGVVTVPVGEGSLGKVVDFLGREVDLKSSSGKAGPPTASTSTPGSAASAPLFALPPTMDAREPISEPLHTGVKGIDALTPVGRGQCLLVLGGKGSGKSTACRDAAIAAARAGVRVAWAAVSENGGGDGKAELRELVEAFERADVLSSITVVSAGVGGSSAGGGAPPPPLAQKYAAVCAAAALGERTRDAGGHALLIIDDAACVPATWDSVAEELAALGRDAAAGGVEAAKSPRDLLEAAAGKESPRGTPEDYDDGGGGEGAASAAAPSSPSLPSSEDGASGEALVEYEGMLVSAAAAARRRFLGSLLQRPAKMSAARGGGSLTALVVLPGAPARGIRGGGAAAAAGAVTSSSSSSSLSSSPSPSSSSSPSPPPPPAAPSSATAEAVRRRIASGAYSTLSEEQKRKLEAALSSRSSSGGSSSGSGTESESDGGGGKDSSSSSPSPLSSLDEDATDLTGCVRTEVIEEFMSIADGQAVFSRPLLPSVAASVSAAGAAKENGEQRKRGPPSVEPASSISRIGGRALPLVLRPLAASLRLDLSQAADAERFGGGGGGDGSEGSAPAAATATTTAPPSQRSATVARAARTRAALLQPPGHPTSVSDLFVTLFALERGLLDTAPPSAVPRRLALLLTSLRRRSLSAAALLRRIDESGGGEAVSELEAEELGAAMSEAARELEGVPPE